MILTITFNGSKTFINRVLNLIKKSFQTCNNGYFEAHKVQMYFVIRFQHFMTFEMPFYFTKITQLINHFIKYCTRLLQS